ncbi:MAG: hypothetical protein ACJASR_001679 [Psychroserpens sp.]|jgi:hypothetical protein
MKSAIEILFLLSFLVSFYTLGRKSLSYILVSSIIYLLFSDYIFYKLGYKLGEISFGKLFIDINFLILFSFYALEFISGAGKVKKFDLLFLGSLFFSILLLIYGAANNGFVAAVNGWRSLYLFIFMGWLIAFLSKQPNNLLKTTFNTVILVCLINSIYSIYEYVFFNGNYTDLWRYNLLLEAKQSNNADYIERFLQYQVMRGSELRSSGFFVSTLASGFFSALASILVTNRIINYKLNFSSICYGAILFLFLLSIYVSQVRTAFVIYFLALLLAYLSKFYRINKTCFVAYVFCLPFLVLTAGVIFKGSLDASSVGRIFQYQSLLNDFSVLGAGLGGHVGKFDSFYIYSFVDLGVFSILLFWLFIKYYDYLPISKFDYLTTEGKNIPIIQGAYLTFFPVLTVQHVASSLYYFSIIILVSLISKEHIEKNNNEKFFK